MFNFNENSKLGETITKPIAEFRYNMTTGILVNTVSVMKMNSYAK